MLLAGSTRPSMKLYRFFVSFVKYIIYNIFSKVRDVEHPVYTRKGVEGIIKKDKKNFVDSIIFISLHKQPKTELTFLLSHVVFYYFFFNPWGWNWYNFRGIGCLSDFLTGMVIGPLWHYDIGLIVVFLLSSWEFMVNCIVFLQGFKTFFFFL